MGRPGPPALSRYNYRTKNKDVLISRDGASQQKGKVLAWKFAGVLAGAPTVHGWEQARCPAIYSAIFLLSCRENPPGTKTVSQSKASGGAPRGRRMPPLTLSSGPCDSDSSLLVTVSHVNLTGNFSIQLKKNLNARTSCLRTRLTLAAQKYDEDGSPWK